MIGTLALLFPTYAQATEVERKTQEFRTNSGHYAGCWENNIANCISGLDKLLALSTTDIFPNENFDEIYVTDKFQNTVSRGFVLIDYRAPLADIRTHLQQQRNRLREEEAKAESFLTDTGHYAGCWISDIDSCIAGLDKLIGLQSSGVFSSDKFDEIYITDRFQDVNSRGFVLIDYMATAADIAAHLRRQ